MKSSNSQRDKTFDISIQKVDTHKYKYLEHLNLLQRKLDSSLTQMKNDTFSDLGLHKRTFTLYVGYIYVGYPPQIIPVTFDTGSGYTWLASRYCKQTNECVAETIYKDDQSKTMKQLNISLQINFGSGSLSGTFVQDVIALSPKIISIKEPIGEIVEVQDHLLFQAGISGIIGLSYPSSSLFNHTIFDGLIENESLAENLIGFYFDGIKGQVNFGYINANNYKGNLISHPVIDKFYWTVKLDDVRFNNDTLNFCPKKNCKAILDTGTSGITVPTKLFNSLAKKLNVMADCSNLATLPKINFIINTQNYILEPADYLVEAVNVLTKKKQCAINFIPLDIPRFEGSNAFILGDNFIRKYYTVFDRDTNSVHLAQKS
jgi:hypothetical protein